MFSAWRNPLEIAPVRVLGVWLRGPVTLGHVFLLDDLGSPVVSGRPITSGDLSVAVAVLSMPTAAAARKAVTSRFAPVLLALWGRFRWRSDFEKEAGALSGWLSEQCGGPMRDTANEKPEAGAARLSAPWYMSRLALAVGELGLSIAEAEAMPVKRLNQLTAALSEIRGHASYVTAELQEEIERINAVERQMGVAA